MSDHSSSTLLSPRDAYRLWAAEYDRTPNPLLSLEQRTLAPLLLSAAGCAVVDLGCGTGRSVAELTRAGARSIVGVDFAPEMLEHASKRLPSIARLVVADCCDTHLDAQSCEWILASFLLSYLDDLTAFAREVARIARPHAFVLITDIHPAARSYGWRRTCRLADTLIEIETHSYGLSDLHDAMRGAGLAPACFTEAAFGPEELTIFSQAGRVDLYWMVEGLPVIYAAGYRRECS